MAAEVQLADSLMTEAVQLHVQRLEEKLLLAGTSLQAAKTSLERGRPDEASQTKTNLNCAHVKLINLKWHVKKISLWPELCIMPCCILHRFIWQFFNNIDQIKLVRKLESGNLPKYPPFEGLLSNIREGVKFIPNLSTPHHRPC